jgi:hypothetical protein
MICYIFSFVTKLSNLLTVSSIDVSDFPPAALRCPLLENAPLQIDLHQSPLGTEWNFDDFLIFILYKIAVAIPFMLNP